jgi:hypothetical protein
MSFPLNLRRRLVLFLGMAFTLWAAWQVSQDDPVPNIVTERTSPKRSVRKPPTVTPNLPLIWPPELIRSSSNVTDIFSPVLPPAPPKPLTTLATSPVAIVPQFNLTYFGRLDGTDQHVVFLADAQEKISTVKVGDWVEGDWQLTTLQTNQLVFTQQPSGQTHTLQTGILQ